MDEAARLATLRALELLDGAPEERLERITRLASRLFDVPIVLISLLDECRQWFKPLYGTNLGDTPRLSSLGEHAPQHEKTLIVRDTLQDAQLAKSAMVLADPRVRFYAGQPLHASNGTRLGTLCVIDHRPRELDERDTALLADFARLVENELLATQLAITDSLTGLSNRRGFFAFASKSLALCRRLGIPAMMFVVQVEDFGDISSEHGSARGDEVLQDMATIVANTFRESDVSARLDGHSFCILAMKLDEAKSRFPLERLAQNVKLHNQRSDCTIELNYRVGLAVYDPANHVPIRQLVETASSRLFLTREMQLGGDAPRR